MPRVLIAVPVGARPVEGECFEALWRMDKCGCETPLRIVEGYFIDRARNAIAQMALDYCCDKVLMVDSDVVVPPNALSHMLESDAPIVLGCYKRKDDSGHVELFAKTEPRFTELLMWDDLPDCLFEVGGGGFGCALVDVRAFRRLIRPYFVDTEYTDGSNQSEDLFFCERAEMRGLRIEADGRVRCKHIGRFTWE